MFMCCNGAHDGLAATLVGSLSTPGEQVTRAQLRLARERAFVRARGF
jgi:hypothetical protein